MVNSIDDLILNVDDIIKFDLPNDKFDEPETITVKIKLIHESSRKKYYYLDIVGLIVPIENDSEYYLTGDRLYLTLEYGRWRFNATKIYYRSIEGIASFAPMDIFNLQVVRKA